MTDLHKRALIKVAALSAVAAAALVGCGKKEEPAPAPAPAPATQGGGFLDSLGNLLGGGARRTRTSAGEQLVKSAASAVGREVGRQIIRGVLGGIFGGGRR